MCACTAEPFLGLGAVPLVLGMDHLPATGGTAPIPKKNLLQAYRGKHLLSALSTLSCDANTLLMTQSDQG